jgi:hypothetical protein
MQRLSSFGRQPLLVNSGRKYLVSHTFSRNIFSRNSFGRKFSSQNSSAEEDVKNDLSKQVSNLENRFNEKEKKDKENDVFNDFAYYASCFSLGYVLSDFVKNNYLNK